MAQACPKCSAALEHDFGVFVCPKCGSVLFVDFDGQVQMSSGDESSSAGTPAPPLDAPSEPSINGPPAGLQFDSPEPAFAIPDLPSEPAEAEGLSDFNPAPADPLPAVDSELAAPQGEWDPTEGISMDPAPPSTAEESPVRFDDVVEYANTAELDSSPLVYTLWIEGIDTQEIRQKVMSVLSESKLNLNVRELLPKIRGGVLEIRDLNPVKTSVIASQLREESVQFRWKQAAFQSEGGAT